MDKFLSGFDEILSLSINNIYWVDSDNVYQGCNMAYAKMVGLFSRADIVGKKNHELPIGVKNFTEIANWDKANLEVIKIGTQQIIEEKVGLMDGTEAIFLSHKTPIRDNQGKIIGLLVIATNITNQKLEEKKLRKAKEGADFTLEYIVAHLPEHIYWKNSDGVYLGSNDQQARSLGLQCASEIIGKTDFELPWGKGMAQIFRENDREVMRTGIAKNTEEPSVVDGKPAVALSYKVPWKTKQGEIIGVIGISIDITDRKMAEDLQVKHEAAKKAIDFTSRIAGSIAHELRTPLAVINLEADALKSTLVSNKSQKEKNAIYKREINIIKETIKAGTYVINDMLLKIKSFASGKISSVSNQVSMKLNIEDFLVTYPFAEGEKKVGYFKNIDTLKNDFTYMGDSILTRHMFANLMKNSLSAIREAGKGEVTIELQAGSGDDKFNHVIFKDTALGIPIEFTEKMFSQFETKKASGDGTGLGLSFCKMVMETYGGDITCESVEGEYTKFILKFPRISDSEAGAVPA